MEIEFKNTRENYKSYTNLHFKNGIKKRLFLIILLPFLVSFLFGNQMYDGLNILILFFSTIVLLVLFLFILYFLAIRKMNDAIASDQNLLETIKVIINEDGFNIVTINGMTNWNWENILSFHSNHHFIFIKLPAKKFILIPRKCFTSENDANNFSNLIQVGIMKVRGAFNGQFKVKGPPYLLGLLCLIPIVGIVFGIILIFKGIFKFKSKLLIIIGAFGFVFNIGLCGTLFYVLHTADFFSQKPFIPYSQGELNNLTKNIEFYKIQYGTYPDSLEQLKKDGTNISIDDVLQFGFGNDKKVHYNYKKVGNKYLLFSSGLDKIPNTDDDLYPTIVVTDSNKFGFINRNENR
jgi:hypothetical protein